MRSDAAPALNLAIVPTWTGTHTFSNGTYSALFTGGNVGIGTTSPTGALSVVGNALAAAVNVDFGNNATQAVGDAIRIRLFPSVVFVNSPAVAPYISAIQTNVSNSAADISLGTWNGSSLNEVMRLQSTGNVGIGTTSPGALLDVNGNFALRGHFLGNSLVPTIAAGAGAGTSPTISITGTDSNGYITLTTGTLPTLATVIATITFNIAYSSAPRTIIISPANSNASTLSGVSMVFVNQAGISTATFAITSGATALTAATAYQWYYWVIQ